MEDPQNYETLEAVIDDLEEDGVDRVGLQGPDGIKPRLIEFSDRLEQEGFETVIIGASTFGACGVANEKAERMGADALIHVGHTRFEHPEGADMDDGNVYYLPYRASRDLMSVLKENHGKIEEDTLGLVGVTQYMDRAEKAEEFLEDQGFDVKLGGKGLRTTERGQVLGCDPGAAFAVAEDVEAFVFLGSGEFHPSMVSQTGKKVYVVDPYEEYIRVQEANSLDDELQAQKARVLKHKDKEKWGVITSSKKGQNYQEAAQKAKEKLEGLGKDVYLFVEDRIFESDYRGYGIDIYVNCACPRMTKDWQNLSLVSPQALEVLEDGSSKRN